MNRGRQITKFFKKGDIVTWTDDAKEGPFLGNSYGEDCLMEVQGYDKANWCRIIYLTPKHDQDIGRENGHPDNRLRLVRHKEYLPEDLFEL